MSSSTSVKPPILDHQSLPGFVGNLSNFQEYRLKEFYRALLILGQKAPKDLKIGVAQPESDDKPAKSSLFSFRSAPTVQNEKVSASDLVSDIAKAILPLKPADVLTEFRNTARMDNPDALVLRFLRARKWEIRKAIDQFGRTLNWRKEREIDLFLERGEQYYIDTKPDPGFIMQFQCKKAVLHGSDKQKRPIVFIHVKNHDPKAQSEESMERFTISLIESARMCLSAEVNTAAVVFDLGDFGLHNMDYSVVKFVLACFEQYYPECLGYLFIHRAPWVFSSVWAIIKGWIDPVVASKISFTKTEKELLRFIDSDNIPKSMGGTSDFEYQWIAPKPEESKFVKDSEGRAKKLAERSQLYDELDALTLQWIKASNQEESDKINKQRLAKCDEIAAQYWTLDPYVRARSIQDRDGTYAEFHKELASGGLAQPTL